MSRTSLDHWQCSVARSADILGDKWTLMILRDAFYGLTSFSQFERNLKLAKNILSDRLEKLVEAGILQRVRTKPGVDRYRYVLSDAGRDLFPVVVALMQWGDRWVFAEEGEPVRLVDRESGKPIERIEVTSSRDGRRLAARDVTFEPGPSAAPELVAWHRRLQEASTD